MKINFYYREPSKIFYLYETISLSPTLLLADHVMYRSDVADAINNYIGVESWSDEMILKTFKSVFNDEEQAMEKADQFINIYPAYKKVKNFKHKDKIALQVINTFKSAINVFKEDLKDEFEEVLITNNLLELVSFIDDNVFEIQILDFDKEKNNEDTFIQDISNTITERDHLFLLDDSVDKIFSFTTLSSPENNESDFIKIPLWNLPPIRGMTYQKMKYTRDNLQPNLLPFKTQLKELSEQLFNLSFSKENLQQIKQLCTDKLSNLVEPVQKSIDESIYITQFRNNFPGNLGLKFCLGITSAETLVDYYEKVELILPYVANEIEDQVSRQIDLKATFAFTYFELLSPITEETLQMPEINS